eukprot:3597179-Pyramimonas_sp.AAC.1
MSSQYEEFEFLIDLLLLLGGAPQAAHESRRLGFGAAQVLPARRVLVRHVQADVPDEEPHGHRDARHVEEHLTARSKPRSGEG